MFLKVVDIDNWENKPSSYATKGSTSQKDPNIIQYDSEHSTYCSKGNRHTKTDVENMFFMAQVIVGHIESNHSTN